VNDGSDTTTYTWNVRNQLTGISNTGFSASFTYDSFGRRTAKTIQGTTTNFVYDGLNPVQEKSGSTVTANLLTGLGIDEFFQRTDGVGSRALLTDALGSTVALGDSSGTLQTQYTYEPFGYTTEAGSASTNSYKYTGREDDGSGLYYYRARYYHPRLQRFVAEDPSGFTAGDMNLYAYVYNAPTIFSDPEGLVPVQCSFEDKIIDFCKSINKRAKLARAIIALCRILDANPQAPDAPKIPQPPPRPSPTQEQNKKNKGGGADPIP
jgi:RHS repeat-associated protein